MTLTLITSRAAPHGNHGEKPVKKVPLDFPVDIGVDLPQGRQQDHPHNVRRYTIRIVNQYEAEPDDGPRNHTQAPEIHPDDLRLSPNKPLSKTNTSI